MKPELTERQIEFLITFFKIKNPNWQSIGRNLIKKGYYVHGCDDSLWDNTEIGKYIKTTQHELFSDCLTHTFDLKEFLQSDLFKDGLKKEIEPIDERIKQLNEEKNNLYKLNNLKDELIN